MPPRHWVGKSRLHGSKGLASASDSPNGTGGTPEGGLKSLVRSLKDEAELRAIEQALTATNWNRKLAAARLNISYKALLYKIKQYGIAQQQSHHKLSAGAS